MVIIPVKVLHHVFESCVLGVFVHDAYLFIRVVLSPSTEIQSNYEESWLNNACSVKIPHLLFVARLIGVDRMVSQNEPDRLCLSHNDGLFDQRWDCVSESMSHCVILWFVQFG
jgi:hypothetical protein